MPEKEILKKSGIYTIITLLGLSVFWFLFSIQTSFGYSGTGTTQDLKSGSRMNGDLLAQPLNGSVTIYFGTQSTQGTGTTGYIGTNTTGLPFLRHSFLGGSSSVNFNGFAAIYIDGIAIPSAGSVSGKLDAVGGVGTNNTFNNPTFAGQGTITASFGANGLVISPAEYASVNNATGELQSQITTATGSITNHTHTGSDGTTQVSHTNLTNKGTQTHAQIDDFVASKASASGLASLDANSLVVQNPASGTSTPGASKTVMSDGTGKIVNGWLSSSVTMLGTPTTSNIPEGSNLYHTDARVNILIGNSSITSPQVSPKITFTSPAAGQFLKIVDTQGNVENGTSSATVAWDGVTGTPTANPYISTTPAANKILFTDSSGNFNFPSGIWNSSGNVSIGTTTPGALLDVVSGTNRFKFTTGGKGRIGTVGDGETYDGKFTVDGADNDYGDSNAIFKIINDKGDEIGFGCYEASGTDYCWIRAWHPTVDGNNLILQPDGGNVGIGTTMASNILYIKIASGTDPIADAWTVHCLADYKEIGTETIEMIQNSANDKVKNTPVSVFTKKAIITDEEAEREPKQKYQDKIKESANADLELYTAGTGVAMNDNSYVDELLDSMWETKADRLAIVEANKQKLIAEKKALPKFQRKNYGIVAEDAPPEAQVLREDGSLLGVDPSVLVGILWSNAQKQETRISALESEITNLQQRLQTAGIP